MNWKLLNFDWNATRAFLVTAEKGSFSAAAKALNVTQSTLSRQISALEQVMEVSLFERTSKGIRLTQTGREVLQFAREMAYNAGQFSQVATQVSDSVTGKVTITAPELFASLYLPSFAKELRHHAPGIELEILATNELVDLKNREADIAIRIVRPQQHDLIIRRLRTMLGHFYASRAYLDSLKSPLTPETLDMACVFGFDPNNPLLADKNSAYAKLNVSPSPIGTNSTTVIWELVKNGLGLGLMSQEVGDAEPSVQRVFPDFPPIKMDFLLVVHRELRTSKRLKIVFDYLVSNLGN